MGNPLIYLAKTSYLEKIIPTTWFFEIDLIINCSLQNRLLLFI